MVVDKVVRGPFEIGDKVDLAYYIVTPGFEALDSSVLGSDVFIGVEQVAIEYQDGSKAEMLWLYPSVSYISIDGGPAVSVFSPVTFATWRSIGPETVAVPETSTLNVVRSLDELVERATNPSDNVEDHLGYEEIYGSREDPSP